MERWNGIKEVAKVTGVAALEGAAIGSVMLGLPGIFAGGIVGGVTALVAEGVGRTVKIDLKGTYEVQTTVTDKDTIVYTKDVHAKLSKDRMPMIQVPDFFYNLLVRLSPKYKTELIFTDEDKPGRSSRATWTIATPSSQ